MQQGLDREGYRLFLRQPHPTLILDMQPILDGLRELVCSTLEQLDHYLTQHPEFIIEMLHRERVLAVNEAALNLVGLNDEKSFADYYPRFFTSEGMLTLHRHLLQIAEGEEELNGTIALAVPGGRPVRVQFAKRPLYEGDLSYVICQFSDITHTQRAEEALNREQHTLKGSPVFSFRWRNAEGWPVESVSPNIIQLGYTPEELLSSKVPFAEMVHPDDLQRVAGEVVQYSATGQDSFEQDYRIFTGAGEVRWIYDYTSIIRNAQGDITHYDGFLLDITSRKQAEQALRASEQRYQEMFESNPVSIWVEDLSALLPVYKELREQGVTNFGDYFRNHPQVVFELAGMTRVLDVNQATVELFEAESKEQLLGSLDKVFCADSLEGAITMQAALAEGQTTLEVETVNQTLTGRRIDVLIKINLPATADYSNVLVILVDITVRKQVEEKLAASEHELATIFDNMQDTYYRTDSQGLLVRVGPGVKEMLGYEPEELLGTQLSSLYSNPEKRSEFLHALSHAGGKVSSYQIEMIDKNGNVAWVSTSSQFVYDDNGEVAGVEGIARNITDIVNARRSLEQSEGRLAEANRIAQLGHYEWNITTGDLFWSAEISSLLGYAKTVAPSMKLFIEHIHPDDRKRVQQENVMAMMTPGMHAMSYRIITPDGGVRILESRGEVTVEEQCGVQRMIGTVRDITQQQREQEELRQTRDLAEQASRLKSDFLANMSHEIRTPMNGLIGFVNLLSRTDLDSEQRDYVETMKTSMGDLLAIVNDILDFSRIESNKLSIQHEEFDLLEMMGDVISLYSGNAMSKGLRLGLNVPESVPLVMMGDPVRLRQILGNLVGNAIKFTDEGGIELRCLVEASQGDEFRLRFEVADSGVGIPEQDVGKLFDAFTQAHEGRGGGTGLGLAISQRLVQLMGGELAVDSREDEGSTFHFTLPLQRVQQQAGAHPEPELATLGQYTGSRVLVVDDNMINRKLITTLLGKMGVETVEAEDGVSALHHQSEDDFDLILMDIRMPGIDGVEATRQIRKREGSHQRVPIIALTAHALPHERESFIMAGMDECLTKPVREEQLIELLEGCFGSASSGA